MLCAPAKRVAAGGAADRARRRGGGVLLSGGGKPRKVGGPMEVEVEFAVLAQPPAGEAVQAAGPSFDCQRATTPGEQAICADPELARRDRRVAESYVGARRRLGRRGRMQGRLLGARLMSTLGAREKLA